jgi:hypothetical protein
MGNLEKTISNKDPKKFNTFWIMLLKTLGINLWFSIGYNLEANVQTNIINSTS